MNTPMELRLAESEARRVRALFPEDRLVRAFVALDLAIRRIAHGVGGRDAISTGVRRPERAPRRSVCRS